MNIPSRRLLTRESFLALALAVEGLAALLLHLVATRWGIGLSPDSATYIAGARGLLQGHGYAFPLGGGVWEPTTLWPPGYSMFLAIPGSLGLEPLVGARWLNALLFGAMTVLVGLMIRSLRGPRSLAPVVGAFLFFFLDDTLAIHGWAWSEPLFLFLGFASLAALGMFLRHGRSRDLLVPAVLGGLSCLVRYAGVAYVVAAVAGILALGETSRTLGKRVRQAGLFALVALSGIALWAVRNSALTGYAGGGSLSSRTLSLVDWQDAIRIVSLWILPGRIEEPLRGWLLLAIVAGVLSLWIVGVWAHRSAAETELPDRMKIALLLGFLPVYAAVLFGSKAFVRPIELDDPRHYVPVYVALLVILVVAASEIVGWGTEALRESGPRWTGLRAFPGFASAAIFAGLAVYHGAHLAKWVRESYTEGLGYSNESWHRSQVLAYVRGLPSDRPVLSNAYDAIYVLSGRETYPLPSPLAPTDGPGLPSAWKRMQAMMQDDDARIAYFLEATRRGMTDERTLTDNLVICVVVDAKEGRVYARCEGG